MQAEEVEISDRLLREDFCASGDRQSSPIRIAPVGRWAAEGLEVAFAPPGFPGHGRGRFEPLLRSLSMAREPNL
jgi:hypothetical protein